MTDEPSAKAGEAARAHHAGEAVSRPFRHTQPEGFGLLLEDAKTIPGKLQTALTHATQIWVPYGDCTRQIANRTKVGPCDLAFRFPEQDFSIPQAKAGL